LHKSRAAGREAGRLVKGSVKNVFRKVGLGELLALNSTAVITENIDVSAFDKTETPPSMAISGFDTDTAPSIDLSPVNYESTLDIPGSPLQIQVHGEEVVMTCKQSASAYTRRLPTPSVEPLYVSMAAIPAIPSMFDFNVLPPPDVAGQKRSLLPVGANVEYQSTSNGGIWIPAKILAHHPYSGLYDLDVKLQALPERIRYLPKHNTDQHSHIQNPGHNFDTNIGVGTPAELASRSKSSALAVDPEAQPQPQPNTMTADATAQPTARGSACSHNFPVGALVRYNSVSLGGWLLTKVVAFHAETGLYDLDCKQDAPHYKIRWPDREEKGMLVPLESICEEETLISAMSINDAGKQNIQPQIRPSRPLQHDQKLSLPGKPSEKMLANFCCSPNIPLVKDNAQDHQRSSPAAPSPKTIPSPKTAHANIPNGNTNANPLKGHEEGPPACKVQPPEMMPGQPPEMALSPSIGQDNSLSGSSRVSCITGNKNLSQIVKPQPPIRPTNSCQNTPAAPLQSPSSSMLNDSQNTDPCTEQGKDSPGYSQVDNVVVGMRVLPGVGGRSVARFPRGTDVEYNSASIGWMPAKVLIYHADLGLYDLSCKQMVPPHKIRFPEKPAPPLHDEQNGVKERTELARRHHVQPEEITTPVTPLEKVPFSLGNSEITEFFCSANDSTHSPYLSSDVSTCDGSSASAGKCFSSLSANVDCESDDGTLAATKDFSLNPDTGLLDTGFIKQVPQRQLEAEREPIILSQGDQDWTTIMSKPQL